MGAEDLNCNQALIDSNGLIAISSVVNEQYKVSPVDFKIQEAYEASLLST